MASAVAAQPAAVSVASAAAALRVFLADRERLDPVVLRRVAVVDSTLPAAEQVPVVEPVRLLRADRSLDHRLAKHFCLGCKDVPGQLGFKRYTAKLQGVKSHVVAGPSQRWLLQLRSYR